LKLVVSHLLEYNMDNSIFVFLKMVLKKYKEYVLILLGLDLFYLNHVDW
jgi:hypothetical protein